MVNFSKHLDRTKLPSLFTPKVIDDVQRIIDRAQKMGVVAAWEAIKRMLVDAKLAWTQRMRADYVGIHPRNRSAFGVGGSDSHWHGDDVLTAGWSWKRLKMLQHWRLRL